MVTAFVCVIVFGLLFFVASVALIKQAFEGFLKANEACE
jgi:hypothetical protein